MLIPFSSKYIVDNAVISPVENPKSTVESIPRISANKFESIVSLYRSEGVESNPLLKINSSHFRIVKDEDLPENVLEIPAEYVNQSSILLDTYYILKPEFSLQMEQMLNI